MITREIMNRDSGMTPSAHADAINRAAPLLEGILAALAHIAVQEIDDDCEIVVGRDAAMALAELGSEIATAMAFHGKALFNLHRKTAPLTVDPEATRIVADSERAVRESNLTERLP
jgi:hypothetical protein